MNKSDYDKYYQQGGSYVIPVEIFNELFEDYECFKNDCKKYKEVIDKAIKYYEANQQECVIGRNKDDKLIKEYYLPAQCSKKMLDILKEVE